MCTNQYLQKDAQKFQLINPGKLEEEGFCRLLLRSNPNWYNPDCEHQVEPRSREALMSPNCEVDPAEHYY